MSDHARYYMKRQEDAACHVHLLLRGVRHL